LRRKLILLNDRKDAARAAASSSQISLNHYQPGGLINLP
jgi:hypothetical protein